MASKKPKPATAGEKIAKWYDNWTSNRTDRDGDSNLSRRIDRAIARAVRKERERCAAWIDLYDNNGTPMCGLIDGVKSGVQP